MSTVVSPNLIDEASVSNGALTVAGACNMRQVYTWELQFATSLDVVAAWKESVSGLNGERLRDLVRASRLPRFEHQVCHVMSVVVLSASQSMEATQPSLPYLHTLKG